MKNWKTTLSGIGAAFMSLIGGLAAFSWDVMPPEMQSLFPPKAKGYIAIASFAAAFLLKCINSIVQKDANPKP